MNVQDLKPNQKKIELIVKVEDINESREVTAQNDGMFHQVADVLCGDETGCVYLSVWDEIIKEIEKYKYYKITNAYTSVFRNALVLNLGKYGKIEKTDETFGINTSNNISLREFTEKWP